jgi:hypothetical protein
VLSRKLTEDPKFATGVKDSAPWLAALEEKLKPRPESDGVWEFRLKSALQNERDALAEVWPDIKGSFAAEKDASELLELRARQVLGEANSSEDARAEELSQTRTHWMPPNALEQSFTKGVPWQGRWHGRRARRRLEGHRRRHRRRRALRWRCWRAWRSGRRRRHRAHRGMARQQAKRSMGEFYDAMLKAKMPDGTPVDPKAARGAALVLGLFNGALGAVPVAGILSKGGLVQKFIGQGGEEYVQRLLASPGALGCWRGWPPSSPVPRASRLSSGLSRSWRLSGPSRAHAWARTPASGCLRWTGNGCPTRCARRCRLAFRFPASRPPRIRAAAPWPTTTTSARWSRTRRCSSRTRGRRRIFCSAWPTMPSRHLSPTLVTSSRRR